MRRKLNSVAAKIDHAKTKVQSKQQSKQQHQIKSQINNYNASARGLRELGLTCEPSMNAFLNLKVPINSGLNHGLA